MNIFSQQKHLKRSLIVRKNGVSLISNKVKNNFFIFFINLILIIFTMSLKYLTLHIMLDSIVFLELKFT